MNSFRYRRAWHLGWKCDQLATYRKYCERKEQFYIAIHKDLWVLDLPESSIGLCMQGFLILGPGDEAIEVFFKLLAGICQVSLVGVAYEIQVKVKVLFTSLIQLEGFRDSWFDGLEYAVMLFQVEIARYLALQIDGASRLVIPITNVSFVLIDYAQRGLWRWRERLLIEED